MPARGTETITVVGGYEDADWQGDPIPGAEPVEDRDLRSCLTWSPTTTDRPDVVIAAKGVFVPAAGNIPPDEHDALLYNGEDWSIDGAVGEHRKPNGRLLGWQFSMRKVT